jgi:hypothetical protein
VNSVGPRIGASFGLWRFTVGLAKHSNEREMMSVRKDLELIKKEFRRLDPNVQENERGFEICIVLIAAAFVIGPNIERLVSFTGYSQTLVADISRRMHDAGIWTSDEIDTDHWFNADDKWSIGLWIHCLVAEGLLVTRRQADGKWEYRVLGGNESSGGAALRGRETKQ